MAEDRSTADKNKKSALTVRMEDRSCRHIPNLSATSIVVRRLVHYFDGGILT
jgi:hypothetical protein